MSGHHPVPVFSTEKLSTFPCTFSYKTTPLPIGLADAQCSQRAPPREKQRSQWSVASIAEQQSYSNSPGNKVAASDCSAHPERFLPNKKWRFSMTPELYVVARSKGHDCCCLRHKHITWSSSINIFNIINLGSVSKTVGASEILLSPLEVGGLSRNFSRVFIHRVLVPDFLYQ